MMGFWANLKREWTVERRVPGRKDRTMALWLFEAGYYFGCVGLFVLLSVFQGDTKGWEALPWMLVGWTGIGGSFYTGGFGLAYLFETLVKRRKPVTVK
jgi:hypothetical protein